jgi:hypothetical protein
MKGKSKRMGVAGAALAASLASLLVAGSAGAAGDSCREWQLEAYLTSCEISVEGGRDELVG